jgi:hypothetical protein
MGDMSIPGVSGIVSRSNDEQTMHSNHHPLSNGNDNDMTSSKISLPSSSGQIHAQGYDILSGLAATTWTTELRTFSSGAQRQPRIGAACIRRQVTRRE